MVSTEGPRPCRWPGFFLGLIISLMAMLFCGHSLQAQQDPLQSLYLNDKLLINPAYAGARNTLAATVQYRHQWAGIAQAPRTAVLTVQSPLKNPKLALGFVLSDDQLGVTRQTSLRGAYAYRIPAGNGRLSLGVQGGVTLHRADLTSLTVFDESDLLFSVNENRLLPNAGFGIYYDWAEKAFVSLSAPRLLRGAYLPDGNSREGRHYFASAGYLAGNGPNVRVRTMALLRAVENAPMQVEGNVALELMRTVWIGAGIRSNPAVTGQLMVDLPQGLGVGYSYDMDLNTLGDASRGSHEVFIRFDLPEGRDTDVASPRRSPHRIF